MKKNTLTTAVVASLAGIAGIANISNAVNLNPDGLGQVLIYPYYTVNNNNQTLISIVNTTNLGKAVKVRILEGHNSREVLDFNLYLSAFDVWTAAIFDTDATGPASIITGDNTCTSPLLRTNAGLPQLNGTPFKEFVNFAYTASFNDSGPDALERTREGYVELIEMGSIVAASDTAALITHKAGVPAGCADVDAAWQDEVYGNAGDEVDATDIDLPTGGLFGGGAIVNSGDGTFINYNADAIDGFSSTVQHTFPGSVFPTLANANNSSLVFDSGRLISSTWGISTATLTNVDPGQRIDAVSAVYMSQSILNEFATETSLAGSSEWVITFPTKRFYVDRLLISGNLPVDPFTRAFDTISQGAVAEVGSRACESIVFDVKDREEGRPGNGQTPFSPQPPGLPANSLCFESQVVSFNQTLASASGPSKILGSSLTRNINPAFTAGARINAGWATLNMTQIATGASTIGTAIRQQRPSVQGHRFRGLPATGFWAQQIENRNARPGVQGFYGGAYNHRRTRSCVIPGTAGAADTACTVL